MDFISHLFDLAESGQIQSLVACYIENGIPAGSSLIDENSATEPFVFLGLLDLEKQNIIDGLIYIADETPDGGA